METSILQRVRKPLACLSSWRTVLIPTLRKNMHPGSEKRTVKNLEVVRVSRYQSPSQCLSRSYYTISIAGWVILFGTVVLSFVMRCYLAFGFLLVVALISNVIYLAYGSNPRPLLVDDASSYNRLVIAASHMNQIDWKVFLRRE